MDVYVDTNVWIDFFDTGSGASGVFFDALAACRHSAVISSFVIDELIHCDAYDEAFLNGLQKIGKLTVVSVSHAIRRRARALPTHFGDAIHACVALERGLPILTWNVKDFAIEGLSVITPIDIKRVSL